jgi:hemoglobin
MASLYERLGGEAAIEAAVVLFYRKVTADAALSPFFAELNLDGQIHKQIAFMTMAFGGPHKYTGRDLRTAHSSSVARGLNDGHMDAIVRHLAAALDELGIAPDISREVLSIVEATRDDVLGRPQAHVVAE